MLYIHPLRHKTDDNTVDLLQVVPRQYLLYRACEYFARVKQPDMAGVPGCRRKIMGNADDR